MFCSDFSFHHVFRWQQRPGVLVWGDGAAPEAGRGGSTCQVLQQLRFAWGLDLSCSPGAAFPQTHMVVAAASWGCRLLGLHLAQHQAR